MITKKDALADSKHFYKITKLALELTKIEAKLVEFGEVELTGSYKYNLMGKPDADFHVYTEPNIEKVADLACNYIKHPKVVKVQVVNYTDFPPQNAWSLPGIWLGLKIGIDGELVNVDVWFVRLADEPQDEFGTQMPKDWWLHLSQEQKEAIIYLKSLSRKLLLDREYMSTEIYRAVVLGGVSTPEELSAWAVKNNS